MAVRSQLHRDEMRAEEARRHEARTAYEITFTQDQYQALTHWLCDELTKGLDAKATQDVEVDYWHQLYEQARTRSARNSPWPDAADLTSYLATEKVDALQARLLRTIWTDPLWTVEGWGDASERAPFVEEFHQWKVEEERLQSVLDQLSLIALIEPRGLLEVTEGTEVRVTRKTVQAKIQTDAVTGGIVYDAHMQPQPVIDPDGRFAAPSEQDPQATMVVDERTKIRTGPVYRVLPYRDSIILPGHARDKSEIWAYGKRFWRRYGDLTRKAKAGLYDAEAVERMTSTSDRESGLALQRSLTAVTPEQDSVGEKELWEILVLIDLDLVLEGLGRPLTRKPELAGERWYLCTLHLPSQQLLRFQHDDLERCRFVPVILFPRPDRVTEGFSFIGHKLITIIEEHTAWRNMAADRAAMVGQAPIKRQTGALWDPIEQPWGPKAVIDVRDMREIEPIQVPDLTAPLFEHIQMTERTAERVAGINDVASGQVSQQSRTLGEVNMATEQSFVRMDLIVRRFQEAMEDLAQIRHAIWQRALAERTTGEAIPASMLSSLEGRGVSIDRYLPEGKITAALLQGAFRFKPRGSVETADPNRQRQDWISFLQALPMVLQAFPVLQPLFQTPQAARAMMRQMLRVFRVESQQAFLGSPAHDLMQSMQLQGLPLPMLGAPMATAGGIPPGVMPSAGPGVAPFAVATGGNWSIAGPGGEPGAMGRAM